MTEEDDGGIIERKNIIIPKSLGASGRNYPVRLPSGGHTKLAEGTEITKVKVIMGEGTKIPINDRFYLEREYHIPADKWQKVRGEGVVVVGKKTRKAELHWYEADDYREEMKVKVWRDEG